MNRFLIGNFAIETKNANLNGSSKDAETTAGNDKENISFVKKITVDRDKYPYASTPNVKYNIKRFAKDHGFSLSKIHAISTKESASDGHPYKNYDEDVLGFMNAAKVSLTEEEYEQLPDEEKAGFKKEKKNYTKNITKKRKSRLQMSPLQAIKATRIQPEFGIRNTDSYPLLYTKEVYSCIMSSGFNLDITRLGTFTVNEDNSGFRDYAPEEIKQYGLHEGNGIISLSKEEKFRRIEVTLRGIQYLNSTARQTNNLEDLTSKFIILGEYRIGNNLFNNIFRDGTLDMDYLKEAIFENEDFRLSKIYIGIRSGFMPGLKELLVQMAKELETDLGKEDVFFIGTVKDAVDNYLDDLKETL